MGSEKVPCVYRLYYSMHSHVPFEDRDHKHRWYTTCLLSQQIKPQQNTNEIHTILLQSQNPSAIHKPPCNPTATHAEGLA